MECTPLINPADLEEMQKNWLDNSHDDLSSGYESTDTWDIESVSSQDSNGESAASCDLERDFERMCEIETEVMKVSSTANVCDDLKLILEMPEMCDVTFLVGPEEIPIHGLKAVLSVRSRVFHQLILKHLLMRKGSKCKKSSKSTKNLKRRLEPVLNESLQILISKYDADVFHMLIQFVHSGTAYITLDNVSGLLCGAVQFELADLAAACWDFIDKCLKEGRGQNLLEQTRTYSHHQTAQLIFDKIYKVLDARFICPYKALLRKESAV